jgi:glycosyltransferase involved in cell wall biosynthesis
MPKILSVATAGLRAGQLADINHHLFPRIDYLELQKKVNTDILDYSAYRNGFGGDIFRHLETQLRSDVYLATLSWLKSKNYPLVFTWSERAGIPFAFYKQYFRSTSRFINMFQCWSKRQESVIQKLNLFKAMDEIIVHCTSMKRRLTELGAEENRIHLIPYSIDENFFSSMPDDEQQEKLVISVGEPRTRDYKGLAQAIKGLDCSLKIAASGHWYAREKNNGIHSKIPDNVTIIKYLPQADLRRLYASAQFVVLPIHNLVYSAGATTTLEASAMARPIIAFRSEGILDYIIDGETGILIDPGDFKAMRAAIQSLLSNPKEARRMGQNARLRIDAELNLDTYVGSIAKLIMQNVN